MGQTADDPSDAELAAIHEVELGVERLRRAHGNLVAFHHDTGRAMDHLAEAERLLRECGHADLADDLATDLLARGVVDGADPAGRWSYDVLESFETTVMTDAVDFGDRAVETVTGGLRHARERRQERRRKRRARR
jgi:hypothetical protein